MILSSFVIANTKDSAQIGSQQIKQEMPQEIWQADVSGEKIKGDAIKDMHSATLLNLKLLIKRLQERDTKIKNISNELT